MLVEGVGPAQYVDRLQATAVAVLHALASFLGEMTSVDFQALDFTRGQEGTGEALGQQAAVVILQHRQGRHHVAVFQHSVGHAELHRSAATGDVVGGRAAAIGVDAVVTLEEVDTTAAVATTATVQTHGVQAEGVDADTHGALGEAGVEVGDDALTPLHLVIVTVFLVTVHVGVAQQHVGVAVFDEAFAVGLIVGLGLGRGDEGQREQADASVEHVVFLIPNRNALRRALPSTGRNPLETHANPALERLLHPGRGEPVKRGARS